jgi:hypothetical protein
VIPSIKITWRVIELVYPTIHLSKLTEAQKGLPKLDLPE